MARNKTRKAKISEPSSKSNPVAKNISTEPRLPSLASLGLTAEIIRAPISDVSPSGEWLFYEPAYDEIRHARRADRDRLAGRGLPRT